MLQCNIDFRVAAVSQKARLKSGFGLKFNLFHLISWSVHTQGPDYEMKTVGVDIQIHFKNYSWSMLPTLSGCPETTHPRNSAELEFSLTRVLLTTTPPPWPTRTPRVFQNWSWARCGRHKVPAASREDSRPQVILKFQPRNSFDCVQVPLRAPAHRAHPLVLDTKEYLALSLTNCTHTYIP